MDFSPSSYMCGGKRKSIGPGLPPGIKKMCRANERLVCKVKNQDPCKAYKCSRKKTSVKKHPKTLGRVKRIPAENGRCPDNYKLIYEKRISKISKKKGKRGRKSVYKTAICVHKSVKGVTTKYSRIDLVNMAKNNNIKLTHQGKPRSKSSLVQALKRKGVKL